MNVVDRLPLLVAADPAESPLFWLAILVLAGLIFVVHSYLFHRHYLLWTKEGKAFRWASQTARLVPPVRRTPSDLPDGARFTFVPVRPMITINGYAPEVTLGGLYFETAGSDGLLIVFPGEGEMSDDFTALARSDLLRTAGLSLWVTDYRGCGRSRKQYLGNSTYPALLNDALSVFDAIPEIEKMHGRPFIRRVLLGRSIGSVPALAVAAARGSQVSAVVLDGPVASVRLKYENEIKKGSSAPAWPEDQPDVPLFARMVVSPVLAFRHADVSAEEPENIARMLGSMTVHEGFRRIEILEGGGRVAPFDGSEYDAVFPFLNALPQDGSRPSEPERCPRCGSELVDGVCPCGTSVDHCPDCGSIRCNGSCPNGCDRAPLEKG